MTSQDPGYGPDAPVSVRQWEAEFRPLLDLYRKQKPRRVLEIGTLHGGTLYHWLQNAKPGTVVVTVDTYTAADNRHLYNDWTPAGVELVVVEGDSRDPAVIDQVRQHSPFGWVFIDAGHRYDEVRDDWRNYSPMVEPGGAVVFHDINPVPGYGIEVDQLWQSIRGKGTRSVEIICQPEGGGGGIGVIWK